MGKSRGFKQSFKKKNIKTQKGKAWSRFELAEALLPVSGRGIFCVYINEEASRRVHCVTSKQTHTAIETVFTLVRRDEQLTKERTESSPFVLKGNRGNKWA